MNAAAAGLGDRRRAERRGPREACPQSPVSGGGPQAFLLGLGTATPALRWRQSDVMDLFAELWRLEGVDLARWRRIAAGSGIESRCGVLPAGEVMNLTTAQRMEAYERLAPPLAIEAARKALTKAGMAAARVTDLIVVSCTGFSAPGLDAALIEALGMRPTVRRTIIGFMGCFGAINGLRAAMGACALDPSGAVLVLCLELCSLHLRADTDAQNMVASALFADGAAAAVVAGPEIASTQKASWLRDGDCAESRPTDIPRNALGLLRLGRTLLIPEGREWMSWRITDTGFAMTLARQVPAALREAAREFVSSACSEPPATIVVHPGGAAIVDAIDEALDLEGGSGMAEARSVLRQFGNMSSGSVLFVLEEVIRCRRPLPALLLAFGPGLTIESIQLLPITASDESV